MSRVTKPEHSMFSTGDAQAWVAAAKEIAREAAAGAASQAAKQTAEHYAPRRPDTFAVRLARNPARMWTAIVAPVVMAMAGAFVWHGARLDEAVAATREEAAFVKTALHECLQTQSDLLEGGEE